MAGRYTFNWLSTKRQCDSPLLSHGCCCVWDYGYSLVGLLFDVETRKSVGRYIFLFVSWFMGKFPGNQVAKNLFQSGASAYFVGIYLFHCMSL